MYQVIPFKLQLIFWVWIAASVAILLNWATHLLSATDTLRYTVLVTNCLLFVLTLKPVWRFFWKKIPGLNNWFPDLNGEYDVELRHNWPIQQRLLNAASGGSQFDPRSPNADMPELGHTALRASIDLGFYSVHVRMWSETPGESGSIIDHSRTLATSLLRPCDGLPARLSYIYQQKNRRERQAITDDSVFEGAAILEIQHGKKNELRGEYWTNRAWHQGLSTAGNISFKKRSS